MKEMPNLVGALSTITRIAFRHFPGDTISNSLLLPTVNDLAKLLVWPWVDFFGKPYSYHLLLTYCSHTTRRFKIVPIFLILHGCLFYLSHPTYRGHLSSKTNA